MRRIVSLLLSFMMIFPLAACGQSAASEKQEEIQPAFQETDEQPETSQNGTEVEKAEREKQPDTETETELSETVSTEEQEADVSTKTLVAYFSCTGA